ncbi:hypothetical protein TWF694_001151 [Orbilia ellipsospora]|uniref:Asl1-like glycosyl hydrolase catalytic domain-containing protein n=1 Tax=Orbilia ellipsospora TaxID=2528407 RepID=A0AAV9XR81_9PEZI
MVVVRKRCLAWDWTCTRDVPNRMNSVDFDGPMHSVSNWNIWEPPELKDRAAFRPMIHLQPELEGEEWQTLLKSDAKIVHYFNEPERNGISAEYAAQKWHDQVVPTLRKQHHMKLVSPSCASDPAGTAWLKEFMSKVQDEPPDYVGVHYYGTHAEDAKKFLHNIREAYPKYHIIVSEIASISREKKNVYAFTRNMANWMDKTDWIFEYAFFGCMRTMPDNFVSPEARLMTKKGQFTKLMKLLMHEQPIKKEHSHKAQAAEGQDDSGDKVHSRDTDHKDGEADTDKGGKIEQKPHEDKSHLEEDEPEDDDPVEGDNQQGDEK